MFLTLCYEIASGRGSDITPVLGKGAGDLAESWSPLSYSSFLCTVSSLSFADPGQPFFLSFQEQSIEKVISITRREKSWLYLSISQAIDPNCEDFS